MSQELPRSLPCLNIHAGIKQLEGNKDLYIKLLKKFAECNQDLAQNIQEKLANQDNKKARLLVHSTKGVSGSIGATELYLASATLEAAITQGETEAALQDFTSILNTVLQSIGALTYDQEEEPPSIEKKDVDIELLSPILEELTISLHASDFKALEHYATLQKLVKNTALAQEVDSWAQKINRFEYKQVAEKLAMLQIQLRNRSL